MNDFDGTDRLIDAKVEEKLKTIKQLTGWTVVGLVVANFGAILGLKGCIQDAAENAAVRRVDAVGSRTEAMIEELDKTLAAQGARIAINGSSVADAENRTKEHLSRLVNYKDELIDGIRKANDVKSRLDRLIEATGLTDAQQGAISELLEQLKSNDAVELLAGVDSRLEKVNLPIGTILPWHKHLESKTGQPLSNPPLGWVECNGRVNLESLSDEQREYLSDCVVDLNKIPDLNDGGRFLRGGMKSGVHQDASAIVDEANRYVPGDGMHIMKDDGVDDTVLSGFPLNYSHIFAKGEDSRPQIKYRKTRPINMSVVWIIRVK